MNFKKLITLATTALILVPLTACSGNTQGTAQSSGKAGGDTKPLKVIADAVPHAELIRQAEKLGLIAKGLVELTENSGQADLNQLVNEGDLDANFFQHVPYLDNWNAEHGDADLVPVATVHVEPLGLYSRKIESLSAVPLNATIAIPADATNLARGLFLLEDSGLLKTDVDRSSANVDYSKISTKNVKENPKNLKFVEIDRPQLAATLDDPKINLSIINGNYALEANLVPANDALALEKAKDNPYANVLVVKKELKDDPRVEKLAKALESPELAKWINDNYKGSVLPVNG